MKKIILSQFIILLLGTLFVWINFSIELIKWLQGGECKVSCSLAAQANPFLTPCFFGALFFTASFVLSILLLKNRK